MTDNSSLIALLDKNDMSAKLKQSNVLTYSTKKLDRNTVRRHYQDWRKKNYLPERCDNEYCQFYNEPLVWNGSKLNPILDHIDGNSLNNSTNNLRFICPNCDSQLPTRGGGNKNRIQNSNEIGYEINHKNGQRSAKVFPKVQKIVMKLGSFKVTK